MLHVTTMTEDHEHTIQTCWFVRFESGKDNDPDDPLYNAFLSHGNRDYMRGWLHDRGITGYHMKQRSIIFFEKEDALLVYLSFPHRREG